MFDLSDTQGRISLAIIILVILAVGYLVWTRSAPPAPRPLPGQSLQNPLGTPPPGPGGAPAAPPGPVGPSPNSPFSRPR